MKNFSKNQLKLLDIRSYKIIIILILYSMIYILIPDINNSWEMPFNFIGNAISNILTTHKINHTIINTVNKIRDLNDKILNENDLLLIFQPYFGDNRSFFLFEISCKIILINSESIYVRGYIKDDITNENIVEIWDYTNKNIDILKQIKSNIHYIPITYHSSFETNYNNILSKKQMSFIKNIDFLIYGSINDRRQKIISELKTLGYNVITLETLDIGELIETIERTKIVIAIRYYSMDLSIDYYRLYLLISNKVFVIHETPEDKFLDKDFDKLIFSDYDNFIADCVKYINMSQESRNQIANSQYNWWKKKHPFKNKIPLDTLLKYNDLS